METETRVNERLPHPPTPPPQKTWVWVAEITVRSWKAAVLITVAEHWVTAILLGSKLHSLCGFYRTSPLLYPTSIIRQWRLTANLHRDFPSFVHVFSDEDALITHIPTPPRHNHNHKKNQKRYQGHNPEISISVSWFRASYNNKWKTPTWCVLYMFGMTHHPSSGVSRLYNLGMV